MKGIKTALSNNWYIFKFALHIVPVYTLMTCFYDTLHAVIIYFEHIYMLKFIIDCIQYQRPFWHVGIYLACIFLVVTSWLFFNEFYIAYFKKKHQEKLYKKLQFKIYEKAVSVDLKDYDDPNFYNDFVWAMNESKERMNSVLNTYNMLSKSIINIITCGVFMVSYDIIGIVFVTISFAGTFLANLKINKYQYDLDMELRPKQRERDYINRVLYLNDYAKEIRLNSIKEKLYNDFKKTNDSIKETIKKRTKKITFLAFISNYIFNSFIFDGLYIIYLLFKTLILKVVSYGSMVALFQSSNILKNALDYFTKSLPKFQENSLYIEKLKSFLEYEPKIKSGKMILEENAPLFPVEFKNMSFSYDKETPVLKNINMTIKPNEKIAIVGHNGAGKTTLVNLILRLYEASNGEILYNGQNIKTYDLLSYRNQFSVVFQDHQLFAVDLDENVAMDLEADKNKVMNALLLSGFSKRLNTMKSGIKTKITREFNDEGIDLSGGEAQKVAIARVIYKNSNIIILDEPSSALDPISEYDLNNTMLEIAQNKTIIFISHRLSTTRMADRIYLLENGEIIEQGNHIELMKLNGKYAYMFNLQAERYQINI